MVFWEHKMELFFLSIAEETEVLVNAVDDDVLESEYEITGSLIITVEIWYWLCLKIRPIAFPMINARY